MSRNERPKAVAARGKKPRRPDERIRRTRHRLGLAMMTLVQEKPFERITVQEVLDRANVGRSTFYLHFTDKDDLFLSQLEEFLEMLSSMLSKRQEQSLRVAPVAEMFAHIGEQKRMYRALAESGRIHEFFDLAEGYFARGIEQRIRESKRSPKMPDRELRIRCHGFAGTLLSLLRCWLDRGTRESPQTMDEMFHRMVWRGMDI